MWYLYTMKQNYAIKDKLGKFLGKGIHSEAILREINQTHLV